MCNTAPNWHGGCKKKKRAFHFLGERTTRSCLLYPSHLICFFCLCKSCDTLLAEGAAPCTWRSSLAFAGLVEMERRECLHVCVSAVLQSEGLITGYLPGTLLTCSSEGVTPVLISVPPLQFSLFTASIRTRLPRSLTFLFLSHDRWGEKESHHEKIFILRWLAFTVSRFSNDIFTLEVQRFLQRESAFEMSTYLKLEMTLTYSSYFTSLHQEQGGIGSSSGKLLVKNLSFNSS